MHYEYGHTRNCWAQHNRTSSSRGTSRIDLVFLLKISNLYLKIHLWGSKWGSKGVKRWRKCTWSGTCIKNLERFYTSAWESNDIDLPRHIMILWLVLNLKVICEHRCRLYYPTQLTCKVSNLANCIWIIWKL
jgi:hypothetical protein